MPAEWNKFLQFQLGKVLQKFHKLAIWSESSSFSYFERKFLFKKDLRVFLTPRRFLEKIQISTKLSLMKRPF